MRVLVFQFLLLRLLLFLLRLLRRPLLRLLLRPARSMKNVQQLLTDFYGCLTVIKAIKRFDSLLIDAKGRAKQTEREREVE